MMGYLRSRWGSPAAADWNERTQHWYGNGLHGRVFTRPTLIGVGDGGPERVDVTPIGRTGARGGALVHVENQNFYTQVDTNLVAQRLSFLITAAGLGSF
jgi:hypothetical protein